MLFENFSLSKLAKQIELASHPDFALLLKHWRLDKTANKRADYLDNYHRKYLHSARTGRRIMEKIKKTEQLAEKLSNGALIMKLSGLKSGPALGRLIKQIKRRIILGSITNLDQLKRVLRRIDENSGSI